MADIDHPKRGFLLALIAGIALVMGLGAGMTALLADSSASTTIAALGDELDQATTTSLSSDIATSSTAPAMTKADLQRACGSAGMELVGRETTGEITPIEHGALGALREICASEGMPLPDPTADDPVIVVQAVASPPTPSPPTTTVDDDDQGGGGSDEGEDDGEYEDDDDESRRDCGSVTGERYVMEAGVVRVKYDHCEAWIANVVVSDGYSYRVPVNGPSHLKVEFRGAGGVSEFQAELEHGRLHVEMGD